MFHWPTLLIIAIFVAIAAVLSRKSSHEWGFRDVLKDPDYWDGASNLFEQRDRDIAAAVDWTEEEVARNVEHFLFNVEGSTSCNETWTLSRSLKALGDRVHADTLRLLTDESLRPKLLTPTGMKFVMIGESPFERACEILGDKPPEEAVPVMAKFLDEPSESARSSAARVLGKIASAKTVPWLRQALTDPENSVRMATVCGLSWAVSTGSLSDACRTEIFDDVWQLIEPNGSSNDVADAVRILLEMDRDRAAEQLMSPTMLDREPFSLSLILRELARESVQVDRDQLMSIINRANQSNLSKSQQRLLEASLSLLGHQQHPGDDELLTKWSHSASHEVAEGAMEGLIAFHGLTGFQSLIAELSKDIGDECLPAPLRLVSTVFMLDAEIRNGGFEQYLVNSSGDDWQSALSGLRAMNALDAAAVVADAVVADAVGEFGEDGPASDCVRRRKQLAKLIRRDESLFDALNEKYYVVAERQSILQMRYVIDNREAFIKA